jgi:nitrous oxide reductase accessory protein NosL
MNRRHFLFAGTSLTLLAACADDDGSGPRVTAQPQVRHLVSLPRDGEPQRNDLSKYPTCTYCGMDRTQAHHSRHVILYDDGSADPTCSLHCTAVSLSVNMDRSPKAVYVADYGDSATTKPLIEAHGASYLVGSSLPDVMTGRSKKAFGNLEEAMVAKSRSGGQLAGFEGALAAAYADMASDGATIRQQRAAARAPAAATKK